MYHQPNPNPNSHINQQVQYQYNIPPPPYGKATATVNPNKPLGPPVISSSGGINGKTNTGSSNMNGSGGVIPPPQYNYNNGLYPNGINGSGGSSGGNNTNKTIGTVVNKSLPQVPQQQQQLPPTIGNNRQMSEQEKLISSQHQKILMNSKEVKLTNDNHEKEMYENLAELYSIIRVTEYLEKLYIRDDVSAKDYTTACSKLIAQFKTSQSLVKDQIGNVSIFMSEYALNCKAAYERLVNKGFPATLEHTIHTTDSANDTAMAKNVAEAVQIFITTMDSIKLRMVAVDNIHPFLSDLMECLNRNTWLPKTFDGKEKIMNWISILNRMKANEELDDDQSRQLLFDLESSYNVFYKAIKN